MKILWSALLHRATITKPQNKSHTNHCDSVPPVDVFCWWADSHTTQNHVPTHKKKQYSVHHLLSLILQYFLTDKLATSSITLNHRRSIHHLPSQSKQDINAQNHTQLGCLGYVHFVLNFLITTIRIILFITKIEICY